ncbi:MAG TPA: carboxylating nicotinate-nucleotide diphosphorylase [Vicinamibacterales bacterium]|nr:carboxylating nicotinate-nucleotide diphosphorylase [Vicinamibacterales bacterium]
MPTRPDSPAVAIYQDLVRRALAEDVGAGDVTTLATVPAEARGRAALVARVSCVVAGLDVVGEVFRQVDPAIVLAAHVSDGDRTPAGTTLATLDGPARGLFTGERTALNFIQHLSGIATLTRAFVDAAGGRLTILDTRKTIPGLRALAKYAVRCGGGTNHRAGLFDAVLIKDNHVRLAGGVARAVERARAAAPGQLVEVETQSLAEVDQALEAGADVIMLDNLSDEQLQGALARVSGRARTEVSGGVTLDRVPVLAALGADSVSVGALTHSAPAIDISLEIDVSSAGPV